uniref:Mannosidase beta like n=1 Tax=Latimeria chalumnae TaxID=7897 RepID=H3ALN5_LATCH
MAAEIDLSPPEIPELTFMENILRYGLFFGAIFQIICILAIIIPSSKLQEPKETEHLEQKSSDFTKKPKPMAPQASKKPKKESKKKR